MLKRLVIAVAVGVIFVIILPIAISIYLSPQDELQKADAIVVISGGDTDSRITEGVKLYLQKWAPKIIFSGAAASGEVSNALAMKRIAIQKGIQAEDILIEENSKTTKENADFSASYITGNNFKSIILVTSPYHQRRAYSEFRRALGNNFPIINHSATDETWAKRSWWESGQARLLTLGEMLKNFYSMVGGENK